MGGVQHAGEGLIGSSRERGAALVEMALVLPLLLMLLLGIVSAGIAYNHQLSLTHAAREAGRYGATLPVEPDIGSWLAAVEARAVEAATGSLGAGNPSVCVAYVHPNGAVPSDQTAKIENGLVTSGSGATCFDDGRPNDERRVQVRVERDVDFNALVFQTILRLDSEGVNRFEAALGF